ncbi:hypothetical protein Pmani_016667 [Petrolisthes manimaculis]|uniref:Uncharacterized protein n=1 Tax=Petrolisthes manimaculis TaxID=1843537 RepID=A0AAE1U666_9EUCA|nr:hypothetical protein Pmani_016667 [Petrolisthes manimaculis]
MMTPVYIDERDESKGMWPGQGKRRRKEFRKSLLSLNQDITTFVAAFSGEYHTQLSSTTTTTISEPTITITSINNFHYHPSTIRPHHHYTPPHHYQTTSPLYPSSPLSDHITTIPLLTTRTDSP